MLWAAEIRIINGHIDIILNKTKMRSIAIISGKGGVGKTTTAINLAFSLTKAGKKVTLLDANLTTPDIGLYLGAPYVPISLQDVLKGKSSLEDAVYVHHSGTRIVPASISLKDNQWINISRLNEVVSKLKKNSDIVIIDAPAGLGQETISAMKVADECLIVTNAELPSITSAMKSISIAKGMEKKITGVVLAKSTGRKELPAEEIISLLGYPILSVIPEDSSVKESVFLKEAVVETHPKSNAAKGYAFLAEKIIQGQEAEKPFFQKLREFLKL
jgi:cell division ATPase MinD